MVLADTSVWISHLRDGNPQLEELLNAGDVMCHPLIIGELACGNMKNRDEIFSLLHFLPTVEMSDHDEILQFIENNRLMGKGVGIIDVHLLASAVLTDVPIWTLDKKLERLSAELSVNF